MRVYKLENWKREKREFEYKIVAESMKKAVRIATQFLIEEQEISHKKELIRFNVEELESDAPIKEYTSIITNEMKTPLAESSKSDKKNIKIVSGYYKKS